jgi:hypothetical protein
MLQQKHKHNGDAILEEEDLTMKIIYDTIVNALVS